MFVRLPSRGSCRYLQPRFPPVVAQPAQRSCSFFFSCRYLIPHWSEVTCACDTSLVGLCHVMMKFVCSPLSKALYCLACCSLGQLVSAGQVEMGWPDIHGLARGQGMAGCRDSWTGSLMGPFIDHLLITVGVSIEHTSEANMHTSFGPCAARTITK